MGAHMWWVEVRIFPMEIGTKNQKFLENLKSAV